MTASVPRRPPPVERYDRTAMTLHWLLAVALFAQLAFGALLDDIAPRGTPGRAGVINLHKSIGIVLGLLVVARLLWRWRHPPPPWPATMGARQQRAARLGHGALYALMLGVPLVGYVASNVSRHGVRFFGLAMAPWGPDLPELYRALVGLHGAFALALAVLAAGHAAVALWHAFAARDGVFQRMWPHPG